MLNPQVHQFLNENFLDFNPKEIQDIIRAEKMLKLESKLNGTFTAAEIEDYLFNIKHLDFNFEKIRNIKEINRICFGDYTEITEYNNSIHDYDDDDTDNFAQFYAAPIREFIIKAIRKNDWCNLVQFYSNYYPVVSNKTIDELTEILLDKNETLLSNFEKFQHLEEYKNVYPFATNPDYYLFQSQLGGFEFTESLMALNNKIIDRQNTLNEKNKIIMGEMLVALSYFTPFDEENTQILQHNRTVGEEWATERNSFLGEITKKVANIVTDENMFGLNIGISILLLTVMIFIIFAIFNAGISYFITFIFIFVLVTGASFFQMNQQFKFFKKEFFPIYFIKVIGAMFMLLIFSTLLFLVIASVFGILIDFSNNKGSLGFLVFPIAWLLIRLFSSKK